MGELLNFLKGPTQESASFTKEVDVTKTQRSTARSTPTKNGHLAVQEVSYELEGLDPPINSTVILEEGGRQYTFKNVRHTGGGHAIAEDLEITNI